MNQPTQDQERWVALVGLPESERVMRRERLIQPTGDLRSLLPKPEVLNGTWKQPPLQRIQ